MRKGRFDEIFFVDLPNRAARADILRHSCAQAECCAEPARGAGAGGSQRRVSQARSWKQAVVAALYTSHSLKQPMSAALIARELKATQPLSVVMGEQVAALRAWAKDRTVPAD